MMRKVLAILSLLGLSLVVALAVRDRPAPDDRIGRICVVPAPTGARDQRLDAGVEVYLHVYLYGEPDECVSSTSLSRVPEIDSVGPTRWRVSGSFVDADPGQPRTPDCNGGLSTATLGHLAPGAYEVESTLDALRFEIPSPETSICVSRR